jgi:hypothetical protein
MKHLDLKECSAQYSMKTSLDRRAKGGRAEVFDGMLIQGDNHSVIFSTNFYEFCRDAKTRGR